MCGGGERKGRRDEGKEGEREGAKEGRKGEERGCSISIQESLLSKNPDFPWSSLTFFVSKANDRSQTMLQNIPSISRLKQKD